MAKDEFVDVHTTEVFQDDASDYPITRQYATHSPQAEFPPQWPAEPHPLTADPSTERWLRVFDISLCLIPLGLIAKAILCIIASLLDKENNGPWVDEVHDLTIYLIRFNHQASPSTTYLEEVLTETANNHLHCCIHSHYNHCCETSSFMARPGGRNYCKTGAVTG